MIIAPPEGRLVRDHVPEVAQQLRRLRGESAEGPVTLDLNAVTEVDSAGVALLATFARELRTAKQPLNVIGIQPSCSAIRTPSVWSCMKM